MNIALEQTEEYVNGQLKNKYGDAFIRGNNGNDSSLCYCSAENCGLIFTYEFEEWLRCKQAACKNITFRLSWKP